MLWGSVHCDTLVVNGKLVIVGGQTNGGFDGIYLTNIDQYDPATNSWYGVGLLARTQRRPVRRLYRRRPDRRQRHRRQPRRLATGRGG